MGSDLDSVSIEDVQQAVTGMMEDLPENEQELVQDYIFRMYFSEAIGEGGGLVQGTTVGEAITEQERIAALEAEYDAHIEAALGFLEEAVVLMNDWSMVEAEAKLAEAEARATSIPDDYPGKALLGLESSRSAFDGVVKNWLGGRWAGESGIDKMTGHTEAVAMLHALNGMPNSIGTDEPVYLVLRCQKGTLEGYVNAGSMLTANYRYDSVTAMHRYGDTKPVRITGTRSKGGDAMFLRNPSNWMQEFKTNDGKTWLIELPPYGRTPHTVEFDLTGSTKAVGSVLTACGVE